MENSHDPTSKKTPGESPAAPSPANVENQSSATLGDSSILGRWRRVDILRKGSLVLRTLGLLFSLLSFIIMASNKHGDWRNFDKYEEYRYLLGISILSTLYTLVQVLRHIHQMSTGQTLLLQRTSNLMDFFGDQIVAYLLVSAASTAIPMTNRMREGADNIFTDSSAASISMAFLAFIALALSAMISAFKLFTQTYF